jgi:N6-adenosine-specific RNA methylase IME4
MSKFRLGQHYILTATGLEVVGDPTWEETAAVGDRLVLYHGASGWWLADWLAYVDTRVEWREQFDAWFGPDRLTASTAYRYRCVANAFETFRRRKVPLSFHEDVLGLPEADQDQLLEQAEVEGLTRSEFRRVVRRRKRASVITGQAEVVGNYRVVYGDPPWQDNNSGVTTSADTYGRAERPDDSMSIADLCALPIASHTRPNAVLFLWVPAPLLLQNPGPRDVIEAWGFVSKTQIIWSKVLHNFGHYVSVRHELLILATRGSCVPDRAEPMVDSVQTIRRGDVHAEKPEEFRKIIERLYDGPYLELFARRQVPGWTAWGNQVGVLVSR